MAQQTETSTNLPDQTALGIMLILASVAAMAFADALVKLISADTTVWQVFAARSAVAIALLYLLARIRGVRLTPLSLKWSLARNALLVLCWLTYYASLPILDLSVAAVAVYTNPIMIALLSAMLIGEPVSNRQWGGVLLGFLGVVAILQPGTDAFSWGTLLPLLAAAFYALAMVLTRSKCRNEAPLTLALNLHGLFVLTGLGATALIVLVRPGAELQAAAPFLLGDWAAMGAREWGLMVLLGVLSAGYFMGVARAYQIAPPSIIATFDYAYLVSAALWGYVFFSETPGPLTLAGMVLITIAGILVAAPPARKVR